jgi:hypothetical protein
MAMLRYYNQQSMLGNTCKTSDMELINCVVYYFTIAIWNSTMTLLLWISSKCNAGNRARVVFSSFEIVTMESEPKNIYYICARWNSIPD